ncbi:MAG: hypothetical protein KF850_07100 [Labilithrix sp.]|nr:hypothetical protein [Labilithrix sp.]MBX3211783.1 hypothetical protein [Labilithrix sp.]
MARHQIVITCLTHKLRHDEAIIRGSFNLHQRATSSGKFSELLEITSLGDRPLKDPFTAASMRERVATLRKKHSVAWSDTRIYLRGHGGFEKQTLGGLGPEAWVKALQELGISEVGLYSITGCRLARDSGSQADRPLLDVANSFASNFHRLLPDKRDVFARTEYLGVLTDGRKQTTPTIAPNPTNFRSKAPGSKVRFTWGKGGQVREMVYQ